MNLFFLLFSLVGGAALAFQAGVNGEIGKKVGTVEASFLAYGTGTVVLFIFVLFLGKGDLSAALSLSWWKLFIGTLGASYIFIMVWSVPNIGAGSALIAAILGQVIIGMILDHFGMFGSVSYPITIRRLCGVVFMGLSLLLFYKG
ncbi:DMT family transporter [Alteribacillus sp. HJP-4]|uniref:DMT family transporter n=1 Tax=Alteribacillus sp. HJP-4 TaxID=2775394 RepID=UPI0035CD1D19